MDTILLSIILLVGLIILYFQVRNKPRDDENINDKLKNEIDSIKNSFSKSFGVTEDKGRKAS